MVEGSSQVFIDARMIAHSGIGTHIRGLLEGWRDADTDFRPALLGDAATLADSIAEPNRYRIVRFRAPIYGLREQIAFPAAATRGALLHCPHYNIPFRHGGPLVVTIHDLIHLDGRFGPRSPVARAYAFLMIRAAVGRARHIFVVSRATGREIVARFGVPEEKVSVVYNAPAEIFRRAARIGDAEVEQFRARRNLPATYLLTVGIYKAHKNFDFLLATLGDLWRTDGRVPALVMAGIQAKERPSLGERIERLGVAEKVLVLEKLPADELPLLYRGALALIYPSLVEGFGLPVVEAQAAGTPVIASRASAVLEVAGDGALFFDPRDGADLARRIIDVVESDRLRHDLVERGRRNSERFSWRRSALEVLSIYERVR